MSEITAHALYEGTFSVGTDHQFNRISKTDSPAKGSLKLSINPFLIKDGTRNILFDAGLGDLFGNDTSIETILGNLESHSVSDFEISDIFISHLHFDHIGGLAHQSNGYWELTFPDARLWISEYGWKKLTNNLSNESEPERDFVNFIDTWADIHFLSGDSNPIENVSVKNIGGHTEHHQALFFSKDENKYLMAGDVIGRRISINRNFTAKYDYDPKKSMKARETLKNIAWMENYTILAYHETDYPMFKLVDFDKKQGYSVKKLT